MGRRIMYYWNILQKDETEIVFKVFKTQTLMPVKNDWVLQLKNDLEECDIKLSDEQIRCMKKERFKSLVLIKIKTLAKKYLISRRGSKSENLKHVNYMKEYLKSPHLNTEEKRLLFALKTRGVNVKTNFKNMFSKTNMSCRLCKSNEEESEIHILKCSEIVKDKSLKDEISKISYSDIFGTIDEQIKAVKVLKKVLKVWNLKLEKLKQSPSGHQVHQLQGQSASYPCNTAHTADQASSEDSNSIVYDFGS